MQRPCGVVIQSWFMSGTYNGMKQSYVEYVTGAHCPGLTRFERVTSETSGILTKRYTRKT